MILPLFMFEGKMEAQLGAFHDAEEIRGRIENLSAGSSALVVLRDSSSGRLFDQTPVNSDGAFRLRGGASAGRGYSLEVRDGQRLIHQENVWSPVTAGDITVTLPTSKVQSSSNETVSVARLLHAPPAKAAKLFEKAMTVTDLKESIALLGKAIEVHPDYIEAHHNLAVRLGRIRQYDRAVKEFETVLELDPSSAMAWANLGVTFDAMGDVPAAETAAKQALVLDPLSQIFCWVPSCCVRAPTSTTPRSFSATPRVSFL